MDCLDVRSNAIEFVDIQFVGSISQLIIDDNLLTSLDGCRPFFNLQSLSVRNNSIESFQNMKRAFSKLYSLAIINLIGNPVVSDEHFVEKVSDLLPAKQFGIRCYVNGNVVDQNSHKFVNTKTPKPADDAIQTERKNIALSLLDDDAILQSIIDKVERFRNGSWDYTEEEYCKERAFLTELSQQVNKALIETQYSLAPDVEIYPHSSIKEELNKALIQNAFCRREKRTFIEVSGVKDIGMSLVATIPVSSSRGVKIVLEKMVEAANELVTDEESLVLDNDLFGMEIQLQKLVDKGVSESIISNVSEHNSDTESQNDKEDKPLDTDQNDEKKPVESVDNGESNTEEEELVE
ncbi:Protein-serine/threonine phosphatase [Entamoeba marina]